MKKILIIFGLFVVLNSTAYAAPEIDNIVGSCSHGSTITIKGKNFGSKSTAAPMKWENFENGTDGEIIAGENAFGKNQCDDCWSDYHALSDAGTEPPKYSTMNNRKGSLLCSRHHFVIDDRAGYNYSDSMLAYEGPKDLTNKVFVSFWVRWNWGTTNDMYYQQKIFRIVNKDSMHATPGIMFNCFMKKDLKDSYNVTVLYNKESKQFNPLELKHVGDINPLGDEKWGMFQMWVKAGASGDGEVHLRYFIVGETQTFKDWKGTTLENGFWRDFIFGLTSANVEDPDTLDTTYYYDDIYIDDSWSRVEIGNKSSYDKCTHREMQIPTSWSGSGTEVSITVNQGSFEPGDLYLYVVDANGVVNKEGFPVCVGGEAFEPPTTVEIITVPDN